MKAHTKLSAAMPILMLLLMLAMPAHSMNCMVVAAPMIVSGVYDPKSPMPHDVQGSATIQCTPATPGEVLDLKASLVGTTDTWLYLRNTQTGERLRMRLYRDPARAQAIDPQAVFRFSIPLAVPFTVTVPIYGRIPAGEDVTVGSYSADFTIVLEF